MAVKISIRPNGPYVVEGEVELVDVNGNKVDTDARAPRFALCRCGASVTKPSVTAPTARSAFRPPRRPSRRRRDQDKETGQGR
jgi:CDGSH-type Zn-finger protein